MEPSRNDESAEPVLLVYNPGSGTNSASSGKILDIVREMQKWRYVPEVFVISPGCDLQRAIRDAQTRGTETVVVSGGDGTVSSVAKELCGGRGTLAVIPTGTKNNIALSLGIPCDISTAVSLLRNGRKILSDVGRLKCEEKEMIFLEVCSIGLFSAVFPSCDEIQHGNLNRIGDFIAQFAAAPPAEIRLLHDGGREIRKNGHVALICNMPYVFRNFQVGAEESFHDGLLDVLLIDSASKLDLIGYALKGPEVGSREDPHIGRFHVRSVEIETEPPLPVMADGNIIGYGRIKAEVWKRALSVIVPRER